MRNQINKKDNKLTLKISNYGTRSNQHNDAENWGYSS